MLGFEELRGYGDDLVLVEGFARKDIKVTGMNFWKGMKTYMRFCDNHEARVTFIAARLDSLYHWRRYFLHFELFRKLVEKPLEGSRVFQAGNTAIE